MKVFVMVLLWIVLIPLSSIWYGYILSILWSWFMVPAFHVAALSIAAAIGVSMAVRLITNMPQPQTNKDDKEQKKAADVLFDTALYSFFYPLIVLGFGAIVHAFV